MDNKNAFGAILKTKNAMQLVAVIAVVGIGALVMMGGSTEDNKSFNINTEQQGDGTNASDVDILLETLKELE